jgi:hypothetical protein
VLQFIFWLTVFVLIAGGWLLWSLVRRTLFSRRVERVLRDFVRDRDEIQAEFLKTAGASGKPRGLAWKQSDFQDGLTLAHDRATHEIIGLVPVTISFEAIEGGGMEEVEAVGNLRAATALLTWKNGRWTTQGRAVFNLEPREVLERYRESLDPL